MTHSAQGMEESSSWIGGGTVAGFMNKIINEAQIIKNQQIH
jgi:hypothetical protein